MQLLRVLRQETAASLKELRLAVHFHARTHRIPIRFRAAENNSDGRSAVRAVVLHGTNLRHQAALQEDIGIAVSIEIGYGEGARVILQIEAAYPGRIPISPF